MVPSSPLHVRDLLRSLTSPILQIRGLASVVRGRPAGRAATAPGEERGAPDGLPRQNAVRAKGDPGASAERCASARCCCAVVVSLYSLFSVSCHQRVAEGQPALHPSSVGKLGARPDPPGLSQASPLTPLFSPRRSGTSKDILTGRGSSQCPSFTSCPTSKPEPWIARALHAGLPPPRGPAHSMYIAAAPSGAPAAGRRGRGARRVPHSPWGLLPSPVSGGPGPGAPHGFAKAVLGVQHAHLSLCSFPSKQTREYRNCQLCKRTWARQPSKGVELTLCS